MTSQVRLGQNSLAWAACVDHEVNPRAFWQHGLSVPQGKALQVFCQLRTQAAKHSGVLGMLLCGRERWACSAAVLLCSAQRRRRSNRPCQK